MKRVFVLFVILVAVMYDAGAEGIRFERVNVHVTPAYPDQRAIASFLDVERGLFYIESYSYAHRNSYGAIGHFYNYTTGIRSVLFELAYEIPSYYVPNPEDYMSPRLTKEIIRVGDILHFPDSENYSYQCSLDGEFLGRFPGFDKSKAVDSNSPEIIVRGEKLVFPITIDLHSYLNAYIAFDCIIFYDKSGYLIVDKEQLAQWGVNADNRIRLPFPEDRVMDLSFIPSRSKKAYIVYRTKEKYKVSILHFEDHLEGSYLETIDIGQPPVVMEPFNQYFPYIGSVFIDDYYYRVECESMRYNIVKYRLAGLEGTSSVDERVWRGVR